MGFFLHPKMIPGVFPTGCLSVIALVTQWLLLLRSHHLTLYNPHIALHCIAGHAWCMLLFVNFRLPHQAYEFLKSNARLCYTGTFSVSFQLMPWHLETPWIGNSGE